MAQPLSRKTVWTRQSNIRRRVTTEERKPNLPSPYIYVGTFVNPNDPGNDPPQTTIDSPAWQNSFTYVGTRYVAFRHGLDGDVEFIGQLDLTQGAVTGTVAFRLPAQFRAISFEFPFPIWIGGNDWITGIMSVEGGSGVTAGNCTVYWPTQATLI